MRFTVRLLGAIWVSAMIVLAAFAAVSIQSERNRLADDLGRRAWLLGEGLKEAVEPLLANAPAARIERIVKKFGTATRGVVVYDRFAGLLVATPEFASTVPPSLPFVSEALTTAAAQSGFVSLGGRRAYYYAVPLIEGERPAGALVIFYDAAHIDDRVSDLLRQNVVRFLVLAGVLSAIALVVVRWSITHPLRRMAEWAQQVRTGTPLPPPKVADPALFGPLATEVTGLARSLAGARAAAEQEALLRLQGENGWT